MAAIVTTVAVIATSICAIKWLKWYVTATSLICFMQKNGYRLPNDKEQKEYTTFVVNHIFKDLRKL